MNGFSDHFRQPPIRRRGRAGLGLGRGLSGCLLLRQRAPVAVAAAPDVRAGGGLTDRPANHVQNLGNHNRPQAVHHVQRNAVQGL
ncbi:MAG: hypothetical protein ACK559_17185, partial [bacterium]